MKKFQKIFGQQQQKMASQINQIELLLKRKSVNIKYTHTHIIKLCLAFTVEGRLKVLSK